MLPRIIERLMYYMILPFVVKIKGIQNIPRKPSIIVANHASYIDGPMTYLILARHGKRTRFIIWKRLFTTRLRKAIMHSLLEQISVGGAVEKSRQKISEGKDIGIFPEGRRTHDGRILPVEHSGLGVIHLLTKAPIVPVAINGNFEFWPYNQYWPSMKRCITVSIGKPQTYKMKITKKNGLKITHKVMEQIKEMLDKKST